MKRSTIIRSGVLHTLLIAMLWLASVWPLAHTTQAAVPPAISLTTLNSPYTQNFDTLANTAGSTTNTLTIDGWALTEGGLGARDNEQYAVDTGASNTGDMYSYGDAGASDRALGQLRSGTLVPLFGAAFTNNTGATLTALTIAYTGEQWRLGTAGRTDQLSFEYSTDATDLSTGTWINVAALNFVTPDINTTGAKNGNAAGERTAFVGALSGLNIANGATFWIRWNDFDASGADDGLAIDDFSLTPQAPGTALLNINDVSQSEGNPPGTTTFTFSVSLTAPAGAGGVTFDIATADGTAQDGNPAAEDGDYVARSLSGQIIPAGSSGPYTFDVTVNRDTAGEPNETFFVNVTNITGAAAGDTQGQGTIADDDTTVFIHDVQGNGSASPLAGATVTIEGVVTASFQAANQLRGFFLQEEDADIDADPATSEGIFVFCSSCSTAVAEGQRVRVTGVVSEFFNMTEITPGTVVVSEAGNHLAEVTPQAIDLPVVGDVNQFYEQREGMLVTFVDALTVAEYFELFRFGQIELYQGGRPRQFTEANAPDVAGYAAHLDNLDRRRVILDDDNNSANAPLTQPDGQQAVFYPRTNGGFSIGTQGSDFFRGGDLVNGLTGVLHWSNAGSGSNDAWRIRPTAAHPVTFTVANPRPAGAPAPGGAIQAVSMNLLNYFTTIDTTSSSSSGPCGPSATLDCRGADSVAELNRQRERASIVICSLDADVYAFMELENTTASDTMNDLLGAVNGRCGGTNPFAFVNTGGTLGSDAIRVALMYRTNVLAPVGAPIVDLDPVHNRPPTAQTFDVVDAANPAFGQRFTVIANHLKSKGCPGTGADTDAGDGQGCFNATRTAQANRLLAWVASAVVPAAGDPDVLLLGDFNSYAHEDPVTTLTGNGFTDLADQFLGSASYSYLFDGQIGHLDYAFANASLAPQIAGVGIWHINADEGPLFDYNDEVRDAPGEAAFEEKPDGSALAPPRVVFQPASPFRASDHDPLIVGLFTPSGPAVTSIALASANPSNATSLQFTVTFSAPVSGVDTSDFSLVTSGITGAAVSSVTGSGATRTVTVATGSGSGTLGLNLNDDDTIVDGANVPLGGIGSHNGDFIGQVYSIDKTAPQAGNLVAGTVGNAGGTTLSFTVVYSDNLAVDTSSLDGNDIVVSGPGGFEQPATLVGVTPAIDGTPRTATYQVHAPGGTWDAADNGSYTVTLQATQVHDTAGNSAASRPLGSFTVAISQATYRLYLPLVVQPAAPASASVAGARP